jgi:hypothetical protein
MHARAIEMFIAVPREPRIDKQAVAQINANAMHAADG